MKMRLARPGGARSAWVTAGRSAAGAVLVAIAVSACTGGGSSVPTIFTPTPQAGGSSDAQSTRTPSPNGQAPGSSGSSATSSAAGRGGASASTSPRGASSPRASASASATRASASTAPSSAPTATHTSAPAFPTAAPETGGGGTAGLQDGLLFGVGGLTVLAGAGSLALRRRLARKFKGDPARKSEPNREPADR